MLHGSSAAEAAGAPRLRPSAYCLGVTDTGDGAASLAWAAHLYEALGRLGQAPRIGAVVPEPSATLAATLGAALGGATPQLWSSPLTRLPEELMTAGGPLWLLVGEAALRQLRPRLCVLLCAARPEARWPPQLAALRASFDLELAGDGVFVVRALAARLSRLA